MLIRRPKADFGLEFLTTQPGILMESITRMGLCSKIYLSPEGSQTIISIPNAKIRKRIV